MPSLGGFELVIILVIVIIIFGVGRLPEIGGAVGKSIREFRQISKEGEEGKVDAAADKAETAVEASSEETPST